MLFTHIGRVGAYLLSISGILLALAGFVAANNPGSEVGQFLAGRTGEAINKGLIALFVGVVLGVITEISYSVRRRRE